MKVFSLFLTGLLSLTLHSHAFADNYAGISYSNSRIGFISAANVGGIHGKFGSDIADYMQIELRIGAGIDNDDGFGQVGIESLVGTYIRLGLDTEKFYPHLLLGYTELDLETRFGNSGGDSDISYGLGVDYSITDDWDINLEYIIYYDKDNVDVRSASFGFSRRF